MRKTLIFVFVAVLSVVAGVAAGVWIQASYAEAEQQKFLVKAQLVLSKGQYGEARRIALEGMDEAFSPFSALDIVAWSYFCEGEKEMAITLWKIQAGYYERIQVPMFKMYREKLAFLSGDAALDADKVALFEDALSCPPGSSWHE